MRGAALAVLLASGCAAAALPAQLRPGSPWTAARPAAGADSLVPYGVSGDLRLHGVRPVDRSRAWWAPLASAVVPGSGQLVQGQRRGVPYLAVEAFLVAQYLLVRDDGGNFRTEYQRLAQVARSFFSAEFPVGDFEYYERMEQFVESGAFDLGSNGVLVPETDTTTFNGFTWQLARRTFWEDPDQPPAPGSDAYLRAVEFYMERAVRDEFRWSWQNSQLEQDLYRQAIRRSNAAFRRSSQYLAVLIANHALSAIDAFVVFRLSQGQAPPAGAGAASGAREYRLTGTIPWAPLGRPGTPPDEPRARRAVAP